MIYQTKFESELDQLLCLYDICGQFDGWDNVYFLYGEDKKIPNMIDKFYRTRFFNASLSDSAFIASGSKEKPSLIFTNILKYPFIDQIRSASPEHHIYLCVDLYRYGNKLPDDSRGDKQFYKTIGNLIKDNKVDFIIYSDKDLPNNQMVLPRNDYFILTNKENLKEKLIEFVKNNKDTELLI